MKILLIIIDALRADSLGCYGYSRATSPGLDRIAAEGTVFTNAYTAANWTNPSLYSLISSLYPSVHGISDQDLVPADELFTLPETLSRNGYRTVIFSNYRNLLDRHRLGRHFSVRRHFDIDLDQRLIEEEMEASADRDWFGLVHIGNYVHEPYCAPPDLVRQFQPRGPVRKTDLIRRLTGEEILSDESMRNVLRAINLRRRHLSRREIDYLKACYDAGIRYVDGWLGRFFTYLKKTRKDDLLLLITADHGQGFMEHGFFGHGLNLHQELIRVPLIFWNGGGEGKTVSVPVSLLDIYPTLTELCDLETPPNRDGTSLVPLLGGETGEERRIICEGFPFVACIGEGKKLIDSFYRLMSARERWNRLRRKFHKRPWRRRLLHFYSLFRSQFYDLGRDPEETTNLIREEAAAVRTSRRVLIRWYEDCSARRMRPGTKPIEDEETIRQLQSLGYL